jgi:broad specificity phosphatase PhoE
VTRLLLARHGETDWNRERRWQGHADLPLNELGRAQAAELAAELAGEPIAAVYSSDLSRAHETARIVAGALDLAVIADPALREIDVGEWSGLTTPEVEARFPDGLRRHAAGGDGWEQGETHAALQQRVVEAVSAISARHEGETVLLVVHGGVIRALLAHAEEIPLPEFRRSRPGLVNGGLATIARENGGWRRIDDG